MASEGAPIESREWTLDPETEYRFELDPGTSLAIKVRSDTLHISLSA
jgi:polyribonucleotide 5'-hydroxyl-kinase